MANTEKDKKLLGEAELLKDSTKKLTIQLKDGSVTTNKIADHAVTKEKTIGIISYIDDAASAIQSQIDSITTALSSMGKSSAYDLTSTRGIVRLLMFVDDDTPSPSVVGNIPDGAIWYSPDANTYNIWHDNTPEGETTQTGAWESWIPTGKEIFFDLTSKKLKRYDTEIHDLVDLVSSNSNDSRVIIPKAFVGTIPYVSPDVADQEQAWSERGYNIGDIIVTNNSNTVCQLVADTPSGIQFAPMNIPSNEWKLIWNPNLGSFGICVNTGTKNGHISYFSGDDYVWENAVNRVEVSPSLGGGGLPAGVYVKTVNNADEQSNAGLIEYATSSRPGVMSPIDKENLDNLVTRFTENSFITNDDINTDTFDTSSEGLASQKTIANYIAKALEQNNHNIFVPDYCCSLSVLPTSVTAGQTWYDTVNNKLLSFTSNSPTSGRGYYLRNGEVLLIYVKKTISGVVYDDVVLYIQGQTSATVYSLLSGNGNSGSTTTEGIISYSPVLWNRTPSEGVAYDKGATCLTRSNELLIHDGGGTWNTIESGIYILVNVNSTSTDLYLYRAENKLLIPIRKIDNELNPYSENSVQNKIVTNALDTLNAKSGSIITVDAWTSTEPDNYNYWYDTATKILTRKNGTTKTVLGSNVYIITNGNNEFYLYGESIPGRLVRLVEDNYFNTELMSTVYDAVDEVIGKIISVRVWGTTSDRNDVTDWAYGEYFYNESTNRLYAMDSEGGNGTEIDPHGDNYYILTYDSNLYLWKRRQSPIPIMMQNNTGNYVSTAEFQQDRSSLISIKYIQNTEPENPQDLDIWYNTSDDNIYYYNSEEQDPWVSGVGPMQNTSMTYLLYDSTNNVIITYCYDEGGIVGKYIANGIEDVKVNGDSVVSNIGGKNVAVITIDPTASDATINKGEVIAPYQGTPYSGTPSLGCYWLDGNNILKKFVHNENTDDNEWQRVPNGTYLLMLLDNNVQALYLYTLVADVSEQQPPVRLATYTDVTSASGGAVTGIKEHGANNPLPKTNDGTVTLPNFAKVSALSSYATASNLATTNTTVTTLGNKVERMSKVVMVEALDSASYSVQSGTYNWVTGDTLSLVIPTKGSKQGKVLLKVINGSTPKYYTQWNTCDYYITINNNSIKKEFLGSDQLRLVRDLFISLSKDKVTFWVWKNDNTLEAVTDIYSTVEDLGEKVTALESAPEIIELSGYSTDSIPSMTAQDIGNYYIASRNGQSRLVICTGNNQVNDVTDPKLYILYYNQCLYLYKYYEARSFMAELCSTQNSDSSSTTIASTLLIPRFWGESSDILYPNDWTTGDVWYDTSSNLIKIRANNTFTSLPVERKVLLFNTTEGILYYYYNGNYTEVTSGQESNNDTVQNKIVIVRYWRDDTPDEQPVPIPNGEYWYDTHYKVLKKKNNIWQTVSDDLTTSTIYADFTNNILYRWNGTDMVAVSSQLTAQLKALADELEDQAIALSSMTGLGGELQPADGRVIGQCYYYKPGNDPGKPYWWNGTDWVDIEGSILE